jgi:hypothetical protein
MTAVLKSHGQPAAHEAVVALCGSASVIEHASTDERLLSDIRDGLATERVHVWMADGRRKPSYDLLERSRRDNADSPELDLYRWHFSSPASLLSLGNRRETILQALLSG